MLERDKKTSLKENVAWAAMGLGLRALAILLVRIGKRDPWLGRALSELGGVYRFENADGKLSRFLVFQGGKVKATRKWAWQADFTFTLYEPASFYLRTRPEHLLKIVIGNKIGQSGDLYYIYQFGFIMSLLERHFKLRKKKRGGRDTAMVPAQQDTSCSTL